MNLLFETPAGYALFRVLKPKALEKTEDFSEYMENADKLKKLYYDSHLESNLPPSDNSSRQERYFSQQLSL